MLYLWPLSPIMEGCDEFFVPILRLILLLLKSGIPVTAACMIIRQAS